jgi:hypothetical protein
MKKGRVLAVGLAVVIGGTATCVVVSWPIDSAHEHEEAARALIAAGPVTACCRGGSDRWNDECLKEAEKNCGWIRESRVVSVKIENDCSNTCKRAEVDLDGPRGKGHCTYLQIEGPASGGCHLIEPQPPPAARD